jgi:hypothetical protein
MSAFTMAAQIFRRLIVMSIGTSRLESLRKALEARQEKNCR